MLDAPFDMPARHSRMALVGILFLAFFAGHARVGLVKSAHATCAAPEPGGSGYVSFNIVWPYIAWPSCPQDIMSPMPKNFRSLALCAVAIGSVGSIGLYGPAAAQVAYVRPSPLDPLFSPYDETYGTSHAFEIYPSPYGGAPAVRVVERCQYPNGWNVTDFSRDVNGIPAGRDHECPAAAVGGRIRARY